MRIPGSVAIKNMTAKIARWPDGRHDESRLDDVAQLHVQPSFAFEQSDKVLALGSCFARNLERRLQRYGFELPMMSVHLPQEELTSSDPNGLMNKYTIQSIENELRWAAGTPKPDPRELFYEASKDQWVDCHLSTAVLPAPLDRVVERRAMVEQAFGDIADCRLVIITLGLAEVWFDKKTNLYLNIAPPIRYLMRNPDQFEAVVMTYDQIIDSLERVYALLTDCIDGEFKMLITVSPVPFKKTFSGKDVLQANMYSKSAQRTAAEAFSTAHENVDYFPSYEIVALSDRRMVYEVDNIHVTDASVDIIMRHVMGAYVPTLGLGEEAAVSVAESRTKMPTGRDLVTRGMFNRREGRYSEAIADFSSALQRFGDSFRPEFKAVALTGLGQSLLQLDLYAEAAVNFEAALAADPNAPAVVIALATAYARAKRNGEALTLFRGAVALEAENAEYRWRLANFLRQTGNVDEALDVAREALRINPAHEKAGRFVEGEQSRREAVTV